MGHGRLVAPALHSAAREAKEAKEALRTLVGSSRVCRQNSPVTACMALSRAFL